MANTAAKRVTGRSWENQRQSFLAQVRKALSGACAVCCLFRRFYFVADALWAGDELFDWSTRTNAEISFVGLENFKTVLSEGTQQGKTLLTSLKNLSLFVVLVVPLNLILPRSFLW